MTTFHDEFFEMALPIRIDAITADTGIPGHEFIRAGLETVIADLIESLEPGPQAA
jgi:hypothetical protein